MLALDRKLLRDLTAMKGQMLAISLVIACGIAAFVMSLSTLESLTLTRENYYRDYFFADVFAHLERAPRSIAEKISRLPGVSAVRTRIVVDVPLDIAGMSEPATARIISVREHESSQLNGLYLRRGRFIEPGKTDEILISEAFALAHQLSIGDRLVAVINQKRRLLRIVGFALSPEYIYQVRPGEMIPDDLRFCIVWMGEHSLAASTGFNDATNDLMLRLSPQAKILDVQTQLDAIIAPYGGLRSYARKDQLSHRYLSEEIEQLKGTGLVVPTIFLFVAMFLLNSVVSRLIATQREEIAMLKAFGYSNRTIGAHYLKLSLIMTSGGMFLGAGLGLYLGKAMTRMYARFFRFPEFAYSIDPKIIVFAILLGVVAVVLGAYRAVHAAAVLPPAAAMRPPAPASYKPTIIERLRLTPYFSLSTRMTLRQLERQPVKTMLSALGIALSISLIIVGGFAEDAINVGIDFQFKVSQRYDVAVGFSSPRPARVGFELRQLSGVRQVEMFRVVPAEIANGVFSRQVGLSGLEAEPQLTPMIGIGWHRQIIHPQGLVLSKKLAELLHVKTGELVKVTSQAGRQWVRYLPVTGTIDDFAGLSAYIRRSTLNQFIGDGDLVSGAYLLADPDRGQALYSELKTIPAVAGVIVKQDLLASFHRTMAENLLLFRWVELIFAAVIGVGVVYNNARISISERARDYATFRIIGFTGTEIGTLFLGELFALLCLAIPLGVGMGYAFAKWVSTAVETDLYRFPLVIEPKTYLSAVGFTSVTVLVTALLVKKRLDRLDLIAVLKSRE